MQLLDCKYKCNYLIAQNFGNYFLKEKMEGSLKYGNLTGKGRISILRDFYKRTKYLKWFQHEKEQGENL